MTGWELAPMSWEALATFATGGAAVGAAWWVGRNQLKLTGEQISIASRQSLILERQVGQQELGLRIEMFDRRWSVYADVRKFLAEIMAHADKPSAEVLRGYAVAMDQSRFLYRPEVYDQLKEIWKSANSFFAVKSVMKAKYDATGDYGQENIEKEYELLNWLTAKLENLSELFGNELRLGAASDPGPDAPQDAAAEG